MVALITYLPFYRVHEVLDYFQKNIEILKPKYQLIYIDNVYSDKQVRLLQKIIPEYIEIKTGNWRSRGGTWFTMLQDLHQLSTEALFVDSDNVLDLDFPEAHMEISSEPIYTVLDAEAWANNARQFLSRSKPSNRQIKGRSVYLYKVYDASVTAIFKGGSLFFIGPKQVVYFKKPPELELIRRVEKAFNNVAKDLRNFISDETVLGVLVYLSGIREVPWIVASHHYHHGSTPPKAIKPLVAMAHYQFASGLAKEFNISPFLRYKIKYFISFLKNINKWK
ncbi:MAG: hypothetical protein QW598_01455 [Pyrobaculum sp.]